jgi:hypothetical protein
MLTFCNRVISNPHEALDLLTNVAHAWRRPGQLHSSIQAADELQSFDYGIADFPLKQDEVWLHENRGHDDGFFGPNLDSWCLLILC